MWQCVYELLLFLSLCSKKMNSPPADFTAVWKSISTTLQWAPTQHHVYSEEGGRNNHSILQERQRGRANSWSGPKSIQRFQSGFIIPALRFTDSSCHHGSADVLTVSRLPALSAPYSSRLSSAVLSVNALNSPLNLTLLSWIYRKHCDFYSIPHVLHAALSDVWLKTNFSSCQGNAAPKVSRNVQKFLCTKVWCSI